MTFLVRAFLCLVFGSIACAITALACIGAFWLLWALVHVMAPHG